MCLKRVFPTRYPTAGPRHTTHGTATPGPGHSQSDAHVCLPRLARPQASWAAWAPRSRSRARASPAASELASQQGGGPGAAGKRDPAHVPSPRAQPLLQLYGPYPAVLHPHILSTPTTTTPSHAGSLNRGFVSRRRNRDDGEYESEGEGDEPLGLAGLDLSAAGLLQPLADGALPLLPPLPPGLLASLPLLPPLPPLGGAGGIAEPPSGGGLPPPALPANVAAQLPAGFQASLQASLAALNGPQVRA